MRYSYFKGIAMQVAILALTGVSPCAAADKPIVHHQYVKSATTAAFSSSGDYIAVANDKRIWVFDANTLEQISEIVDYEYVDHKWKFQYRYGLGNSLEFVSSDEVVTAGLGAMLTYWDIRTGSRTNVQDWDVGHGYPVSLAYSPGLDLLAAGTSRGTVILSWPGTNKPSRNLAGYGGAVLSLLFSENDRYLAAAGTTSELVIWDLQTMQEYARLPTNSATVEIARFGKSGQILVAGKDLEIWNFLSQDEVGKLDNPNLVAQAIGSGALFALSIIPFIPIATSAGGTTVAPSDLGLILFPIPNSATANCSRVVAVSPDGSLVADTHPGVMKERTRIIEAESGELLRELNPKGGRTCDLEFSPDGSLLLIANSRGAHLFDTKTWEAERIKMRIRRLEK
jgi:WD40 repeat protein